MSMSYSALTQGVDQMDAKSKSKLIKWLDNNQYFHFTAGYQVAVSCNTELAKELFVNHFTGRFYGKDIVDYQVIDSKSYPDKVIIV
jgi:hypothetical protein